MYFWRSTNMKDYWQTAQNRINLKLCLSQYGGGEGGIRTPGDTECHTGFRNRPDQPLWHLSETFDVDAVKIPAP